MYQKSEEQPRYVIDDEYKERESETKILSDEQSKVLQKLLKQSGHTLSGEERDLIVRLIDKLDRETQRVQTLRKVTVSDKPLDEYLSDWQKKKGNHKVSQPSSTGEDEEYDEEAKERKHSAKIKHVVGFKPEEVVRRYIECWNQQKFGAEFDCFSPDFMKTDRDHYIQARQNFYQKQLNQGGMRIDFGEILTVDTAGGESEIIASKVIQQGNKKPREEKDLYRLKLVRGRWLIYHVEQI